MKPGEAVSQFETELAAYCGSKWAIAAANGTATLQAALVALGVKPGDRVATVPLTHSATSIAILNVGAAPVYCDVNPDTWLMSDTGAMYPNDCIPLMPVSLYGLHSGWYGLRVVDDAAQTLRPHGGAVFTSLSFQQSKILSLSEGGALLTDSDELASLARSYLSLGYEMSPGQSRISKDSIKSPDAIRHVRYPAINARMNDLTAAEGLKAFAGNGMCVPEHQAKCLVAQRRLAASFYRDAIAGCSWLQPQLTPDGWTHDYWAFAVACDTPQRALQLSDAIVKHGGEKPFPAWRLTYHEPAFAHLAGLTELVAGERTFALKRVGLCPNAESLQPRLLQFQTNNLDSASRNASALRKAIQEMGE